MLNGSEVTCWEEGTKLNPVFLSTALKSPALAPYLLLPGIGTQPLGAQPAPVLLFQHDLRKAKDRRTRDVASAARARAPSHAGSSLRGTAATRGRGVMPCQHAAVRLASQRRLLTPLRARVGFELCLQAVPAWLSVATSASTFKAPPIVLRTRR